MAKIRVKTWDASKSPAENARDRLPGLARRYFRAGRKSVDRKVPPEELHQFRLDTKRFRYTLELFMPLYGPGLEQRFDGLRKVQNYLGDISDCMATAGVLGDEAISLALKATARKKAQEFRRHWREVFDKPGEEARWVTYLSRNAREKARS